jgi:VCBS repeat-containing protein
MASGKTTTPPPPPVTGGSGGSGGGGGGGTVTTKPTISFSSLATTGTVKEDDTLTTSGTLTAVSSDPTDTFTWSMKSNAVGTYGSLELQADGSWKYVLNNSSATVQALTSADVRTETFTVQVLDAFGTSVTKNIVITVGGTNEKPVISAAPGQDLGFVVENGASAASGQFSATSVEKNVTLTWSAENNGAGQYGTLSVNNTGAWKYDLDQSKASVQALASGDQVTETITVKVTDNAGQVSTKQVTITINGTDDTPTVDLSAGQDTGAITEDAAPTVTGQLTASSVDNNAGALVWSTVKADGKGDYGHLSIDPSGAWNYSIDNSDPAVQALVSGQTVTDSINVQVTDAKGMITKEAVTVTISGTNDAPVIAGLGSGIVQEDGVQAASGQLSASSVDAGALLTWAAGDAQGAYGSLALDANGAWTYTLDNANADVQALGTGDSLTDLIAVQVSDEKGMITTSSVSVQVMGYDENVVVIDPPPVVVDPPPVDTSGGTGGGGVNSGGVNSGGGKTLSLDSVATTTYAADGSVAYVTYGSAGMPVSTYTGPAPFTVLQDQASVMGEVNNALFAGTPGITIDQASFQVISGAKSVMHYDGNLPLGIGAGLLITSGGVPGTVNTSSSFSVDNGMAGDVDLNAIVQTVFPTTGYDATTISFDFFVADESIHGISFNAVFGSDEYPEWVDTIYVDIAAVIVNGVNTALFDPANPLTPLSIIGSNLSANYFINNTDGHLPIEYDGITHTLNISAPVHQGLNTIKIGISDTGDHIYDSGLFLSNLTGTTYSASGVYIEHQGTESAETQSGGAEAEMYDAMGGNDVVFAYEGNDVVLGGAGDDWLNGGGGADTMQGGTGADTFVFEKVGDSAAGSMDTIIDFNSVEGDKIDLHAIDANSATAAVDMFMLVGAFSGSAGELTIDAQSSGGWLVQGDVNGDGIADLMIAVLGPTAPTADSIFLG